MRLGSHKYIDPLKRSDKLFRFIFQITWRGIGFLFPGRTLNCFKLSIINLFGGNCDRTAVIYSSSKIFDPRKLKMSKNSTIGPYVIIYNVDIVTIGEGSIISQYSHLSTASHDFRQHDFPLIHAPINIGSNCWIATEVYVNMGVSITNETVVGARSSVFKSIIEPGVYLGSPARKTKAE